MFLLLGVLCDYFTGSGQDETQVLDSACASPASVKTPPPTTLAPVDVTPEKVPLARSVILIRA